MAFVKQSVDRCGEHTTPIVIILDAADQHNFNAECTALAELHNIKFVGVPPKMSHVFQPADQFVICNLKKYVVNSPFVPQRTLPPPRAEEDPSDPLLGWGTYERPF